MMLNQHFLNLIWKNFISNKKESFKSNVLEYSKLIKKKL